MLAETRWDRETSVELDWVTLYCLEKLLNVEYKVTVPKPTQVGG